MKIQNVSLPEIIGDGYGEFWRSKARYRVVKGSRASKKSTTTALWIIASMMKYPQANSLVIRKVYRTIKDSCFAQLKWAVNRLKVDDYWTFRENPLEAVYKPTGQKILFRGLDDPQKVTSIAVDTGVLCWAWIEEAYEVMSEADFDMLDESIRGELPEGLFKQITMTFNPWNERHWIKGRFFDPVEERKRSGRDLPEDVSALTTNYLCNEWLDDADRKVFEEMKTRNPRRYRVAGLGDWGIVEGLVYENFREEEFSLQQVQNNQIAVGLDFGYTNDPSALWVGFLDQKNKRIYVWDELYEKGLSNRKIYDRVITMGYGKEKITGDSSEPKSIDELRGYGLRIKGAQKGPDSIANGIQWIQDYEIIIHPRCNNFLTEINNYTWSVDKFGKKLNKPIDDFNHLLDAMRYALEEHIIERKMVVRTFKGGF